MLIDDVANAPHYFDLRIVHASASRMAALAGAKAGLFRSFGNLKEAHLFALRASRRARRPAIDSGRAHREHKAAIARCITRQHRVPKLRIVSHVGHDRYRLHLYFTSLTFSVLKLPTRYHGRFGLRLM